MSDTTRISVQDLHERYQRDGKSLTLIDVRSPAEYRAAHVPIAELHPLDQLDVETLKQSHQPSEAQPLHLICKSGSRSEQARKKLEKAGVDHAVTVEGGTEAWIDQGYDVQRGESVMSLERQVRIAAGSLVAIGVASGWVLSPWVLLLPLAIGCGLVFSGLTNTCGMGQVLLKMPWNR